MTHDEDEDEDLGTPVDLSVLTHLEESSGEFFNKLQRRIERRQTGADIATFFWSMPAEVLRGFMGLFEKMPDSIVSPKPGPKEPEEP